MLDDGQKFAGIIGLTNHHDTNELDLSQASYHKLGESTNMSIDSHASLQTSNDGGSVAMSVDNSGIASNESDTRFLKHQGLKMSVDNSSIASNESDTRFLKRQGLKRRGSENYSVAYSVNRRGRVTHPLSDDALAQALLDSNFPTFGPPNFEEWTIDLRKMNLGAPFAQGAFPSHLFLMIEL